MRRALQTGTAMTAVLDDQAIDEIYGRLKEYGAPVHADVMALLGRACARFGPRPALLERDFNYPAWPELRHELQRMRALQAERARTAA